MTPLNCGGFERVVAVFSHVGAEAGFEKSHCCKKGHATLEDARDCLGSLNARWRGEDFLGYDWIVEEKPTDDQKSS